MSTIYHKYVFKFSAILHRLDFEVIMSQRPEIFEASNLLSDVEPPVVNTCEGPETDNSYIFSNIRYADVTWPEPTFSDNSGKKVSDSKSPEN